MNTIQKQFILISHAAAITLVLPFFGYSTRWLNNGNTMPASVIHPSHQLEAQTEAQTTTRISAIHSQSSSFE